MSKLLLHIGANVNLNVESSCDQNVQTKILHQINTREHIMLISRQKSFEAANKDLIFIAISKLDQGFTLYLYVSWFVGI